MIVNIHFEFDENIMINITETLDEKLLCVDINTLSFYVNEKQAKELCEKLEKHLYYEPSYEELVKLCDDQHIEIENLEEERDELYQLLAQERVRKLL